MIDIENIKIHHIIMLLIFIIIIVLLYLVITKIETKTEEKKVDLLDSFKVGGKLTCGNNA